MRKEELESAIKIIADSLRKHIITSAKGNGSVDGEFMAILVRENKEVISHYLNNRSITFLEEVAYFIDFLKQVSKKFIKEGDSALFLIYIIAWFNLKDYARENMIRNKSIYMNSKLDIIRKEYVRTPRTFMAQCMEETYNYSNTLKHTSGDALHGFSIYNYYHIPFILNTVIEISIENEKKRWKAIEEKVEQSMISK